MRADAVETLYLTNARVRELMTSLQSGDGLVKHEVFERLLAEVTRAGTWLRQVSADSRDPGWAKEVAAYRDSMEQLRQMLPGIQSRVLAEKVRMEASHSHLAAATAWSKASRNTL